MKYYLKIIDGKETAIITCDSFQDALNTRNAFVIYITAI